MSEPDFMFGFLVGMLVTIIAGVLVFYVYAKWIK